MARKRRPANSPADRSTDTQWSMDDSTPYLLNSWNEDRARCEKAAFPTTSSTGRSTTSRWSNPTGQRVIGRKPIKHGSKPTDQKKISNQKVAFPAGNSRFSNR